MVAVAGLLVFAVAMWCCAWLTWRFFDFLSWQFSGFRKAVIQINGEPITLYFKREERIGIDGIDGPKHYLAYKLKDATMKNGFIFDSIDVHTDLSGKVILVYCCFLKVNRKSWLQGYIDSIEKPIDWDEALERVRRLFPPGSNLRGEVLNELVRPELKAFQPIISQIHSLQ